MEKQAHIKLLPIEGLSSAIIVGDPARVDNIAKLADSSQPLEFNREFKSALVMYKGKKILALSTGIGAPSCAIAVEEAYNIGIRNIIRVGSAGSLKKDFTLGQLLVCTAAVRDEGLTERYLPKAFPAIASYDLVLKIMQAAKIQNDASVVYGVARSHDGFYIPNEEKVQEFWADTPAIGEDMETSTLFICGMLKGIKTASILNNVVNYGSDTAEGIKDYVEGGSLTALGETASIKIALNALSA
ncbi:MAG: nucleoside phosphorylase [Spirochaetaceae bacterium]|jgi:uridine phosphorylase|nr:nucleoside phosphorylase [Spirochaetaceae bacterium]